MRHLIIQPGTTARMTALYMQAKYCINTKVRHRKNSYYSRKCTKGIAENAFAFQYGIKEINLPNTVTNIGEFAFYRCDLMTDIYIPGSVTEIGEYALGYFNNLEGTKVPDFTIYGVAVLQRKLTLRKMIYLCRSRTGIHSGRRRRKRICRHSRSSYGTSLRVWKGNINGRPETGSDVEKDDVVNIQDLRKILRFVCRKIDSLA